MTALLTILLLLCSNAFMTIAWYGHLRMSGVEWFQRLNLGGVILLSWAVALLEYCFQVPANRIGYHENGGPFNLIQLKIIQEVLSLSVFVVFSLFFAKNESLRWNHAVAAMLMVAAVYFVFKD